MALLLGWEASFPLVGTEAALYAFPTCLVARFRTPWEIVIVRRRSVSGDLSFVGPCGKRQVRALFRQAFLGEDFRD